MRFAISTIGLVLFLTGCGGGGGGDTAVATSTPDPIVWVAAPVSTSSATVVATPATVTTPAKSSTCVVKSALTDKYHSAIMDMRFEHVGDYTADGKLVNSYDAVARVIDKIDCVGFDTIVFQTNLPIDIKTGHLELYDSSPGAHNRDKNVPKDFWRLVKYSKDRGLRVFVKAIPVNHTNDVLICPGCDGPAFVLPTTFSTTNFFNALVTYQRVLAVEAEKHKVDGFYIGTMNLGLDTTPYMTNWDNVITQIKTVYTGKLIYESCDRCTTQVWSRVDLIAVGVHAKIAKSSATTMASIINDTAIFNLIVDIQRIATLYQKPILLDGVSVGATGKDDDLGSVISGQTPYTSLQPNYALQAVKIATVFELVGSKLTKQVVGVQWSEYMPWSQATWIQNPTNANSWAWHHAQFYGIDLLNNEPAQKKLSEHFSKPWGHTVN
jgi:hypothetical protein